MKKAKRLLSALLALAMVFTMFPTSVFAAAKTATHRSAERQWPEPGTIYLDKTPKANSNDDWTFDVTLSVEGKNIIRNNPASIVMVLDVSGSMASNSYLTKALTAAQNMVNTLLADANSQVEIALVTY